MSFATTYCRAALGIDAPLVSVETHLANGLPAFNIVGLPEKAVQESRDRVRSALLNSGFEFPARRITVNLAPADLPKQGSRFDLAIAVGILVAGGQLPDDAAAGYEMVGELSLAGALREVTGVLPLALASRNAGARLLLPAGNLAEAGLVDGIELYPAEHLLGVSAHLAGEQRITPASGVRADSTPVAGPDLRDVYGQALARRALEVTAAGRHNLLMMGPPGSGKSMLANRLPGILPPLDDDEALATAALRSIAGLAFDPAGWRTRPFRAPHHTASGVALVGGGGTPKPGEISLAHNGVLFLDELPEFDPRVLEVLREPLESGRILISRAARQAEFPADFQLIAAMNPCPCGHAGDAERACADCSPERAARYQRRISGPLRDRIDIQIEVPALPHVELLGGIRRHAADSASVRARVMAARTRQVERQGVVNARLQADGLQRHCALSREGERLLADAIDRLGLSARAFHRILRVARTVADLDGASTVADVHLSEAIAYRRLDRGRT
ncbi:MAG: YifB family Mg chelatase-like AAA ATPase [Chromatiaceae bacterium]|nr:YifB family Mg chelatase-like AAA ATPase [Chromatiaceae bacterium]MCP5422441.1 YifB family Mg chelatase-like AAA ATPase [Chromatiaceae bacterium]